ncbi:MAG: EF-P 5-aminopentanol modification-associated protein YfmF [Clostridia bacterium]
MNYQKEKIKKGITLHQIDTKKFKTNLLSVFITVPLAKETVTLNSVLVAILRRGSKNMPTQEMISKKLENMYGAAFDCGIDKVGDNQILKFYFESVNDIFLPEQEDVLRQSIDKLLEIVFNPYVESNGFKEEYVQGEKQNIRKIIEGKIDNKAQYALNRCIEEMYKDKPYGIYKFGYVEDLEKINRENLYEHYKNLIQTSKIDIFVSGDMQKDIIQVIRENENIKQLQEREPQYILNNEMNTEKKQIEEVKKVQETMDVNQGKLVMGLDIDLQEENVRFPAVVYNGILGGTANSKLFQNVREKASLAYSASSSYIRQKNNIFIRCGIEAQNYEKAVEIITEQIENMKQGKFEEEEIENAKKSIISGIDSIDDEQDTEIVYVFGQELTKTEMSIEEYRKNIEEVTKEQILKIANSIKINTIYLLKGNEKGE